MIDKICELLTIRIQKQMPEIDEEKAEVIKYGLELIIGEIPKILLLFIVAAVLKIGWLVIFAYITMLPYKIVAGGFHLKTNIGCTIGTFVVYFGNVLLSKYIVIGPIEVKIAIVIATFIYSIIMISIYAPADTINLPILRKKERKLKKILSFVFASVTLILSLIPLKAVPKPPLMALNPDAMFEIIPATELAPFNKVNAPAKLAIAVPTALILPGLILLIALAILVIIELIPFKPLPDKLPNKLASEPPTPLKAFLTLLIALPTAVIIFRKPSILNELAKPFMKLFFKLSNLLLTL